MSSNKQTKEKLLILFKKQVISFLDSNDTSFTKIHIARVVWNWLANPMFSFGNVWGMHRGCWGMSGEFVRDYYELFGKQLIFVGAAGECIGNSSGILTNYLGNRWYS